MATYISGRIFGEGLVQFSRAKSNELTEQQDMFYYMTCYDFTWLHWRYVLLPLIGVTVWNKPQKLNTVREIDKSDNLLRI